jgi:hypothetical protein
MVESNEDRADEGERAILTVYRDYFNGGRPADAESDDYRANMRDVIGDTLAYIAHYCERWRIDPNEAFARGLRSYCDDVGNDPAFGSYRAVRKMPKRVVRKFHEPETFTR